MNSDGGQALGLIVRHAPYAQRSARAQLDMALAAAALECPLELYFLGAGIWQLVAEREVDEAFLPRGLKGWGALREMTDARFFAELACVDTLQATGVEVVVRPEPLDAASMARRWRHCARVMSL